MQLTHEQQQTIEQGGPVPVVVNRTECILIRKDVYEREQREFDPRETYAAVLKAWDADDDDPQQYQEYLRDV